MKQTLFLIFGLSCGLTASAQRAFTEQLQRAVPGQGTVTLHQSAKLTALVNGSSGAANVTSTPPKTANTTTSTIKSGTSVDASKTTTSTPTTPTTTPKTPTKTETKKPEKTEEETPAEVDMRLKAYRRRAKVTGYRIQVYAGGNSRDSRREAERMGVLVKQNFPDVPVYTHFYNPRWICRAGDFRSYEEANSVLRRMRATKLFKEASIIKCQIQVGY